MIATVDIIGSSSKDENSIIHERTTSHRYGSRACAKNVEGGSRCRSKAVARLFGRAIAAAAIVCTGGATAQDPYSFTHIDSVPGLSADQLYLRARRWFVDAFKDADEVIQLDDAANHTIVGKGWFPYHDMGRIWFTVEVITKPNKYRVRIYDYQHVGVGGLSSGFTYVPYPDYGLIYAGKECYTPKPSLMIVEGSEHDMMIIDCAIIQPVINKETTLMRDGLRLALTTTTAADW